MWCLYRRKQIIKDYKDLKKEVAKDFINTIKEFKKRHPYVKKISFRSSYNPWLSNGTIFVKDKFDIVVYEDDIDIKE